MGIQALEFFSGVGGWRYALSGRGQVVAAYDIHPGANATYELNHGHRPLARDLSSLPFMELQAHGADTWMMSPPCQPFCRMGNRSGLEDPRSAAFLRLMAALDASPPEHLVLENVVGFDGSEGHALLARTLERNGFQRKEFTLCPTRFGLPNQRPRFYVVASRQPLLAPAFPDRTVPALRDFLDEHERDDLYLREAELRHVPGMDLVKGHDRRSACFIGGYGQRFMGSGSFLVTARGIRRFSPREVARLLGYPDQFEFPNSVPLSQRFKLLGNGLSLPVARWVAEHLPSSMPGQQH